MVCQVYWMIRLRTKSSGSFPQAAQQQASRCAHAGRPSNILACLPAHELLWSVNACIADCVIVTEFYRKFYLYRELTIEEDLRCGNTDIIQALVLRWMGCRRRSSVGITVRPEAEASGLSAQLLVTPGPDAMKVHCPYKHATGIARRAG